MGHSHYIRGSGIITKKVFAELTRYAKAICDEAETNLGIPLEKSFKAGIEINGVGEDSCENLSLAQLMDSFSFCKTYQRPYDIVVVAVLEAGWQLGAFEWSSDGNDEENAPGIALFGKIHEKLRVKDTVKPKRKAKKTSPKLTCPHCQGSLSLVKRVD